VALSTATGTPTASPTPTPTPAVPPMPIPTPPEYRMSTTPSNPAKPQLHLRLLQSQHGRVD
jgi:hypothetical protein